MNQLKDDWWNVHTWYTSSSTSYQYLSANPWHFPKTHTHMWWMPYIRELYRTLDRYYLRIQGHWCCLSDQQLNLARSDICVMEQWTFSDAANLGKFSPSSVRRSNCMKVIILKRLQFWKRKQLPWSMKVCSSLGVQVFKWARNIKRKKFSNLNSVIKKQMKKTENFNV